MLVLAWLLGEDMGCRTLALTGKLEGDSRGVGAREGEDMTGGALVVKVVADDKTPPLGAGAMVMGM